MASLAKGLAPAASAVVAGTGLVGLVASYISDNAAVPKFSLDTERFDQSTFFGRVKRFMVASNPSTLFVSDEEALAARFGLSFIIKRKCPPEKVAQLLRFVAFPSCVVASSANCYIMRSPEIKGGWQLRDKGGNVAAGGEHSRVAAKQGVYQTAATRALLQIPSILLPVLFTAIPAVSTLIAVNPVLNLPITTFVCLSCFGIGLPLSLSAFPQIVAISPAKLETNFRSYYGDDELLFYNRGL